MAQIPTFDELLNNILQAVHDMGGSGNTFKIKNSVANMLRFSAEQREMCHQSGGSYNLLIDSVLSHLTIKGLLENQRLGVWEITAKGRNIVYANSLGLDSFHGRLLAKRRRQQVTDSSNAPETARMTKAIDSSLPDAAASANQDSETDAEMTIDSLPAQKDFICPTFEAFHNLGGSGINQEIYDEVARIMNLSDEQLAIPHKRAKSMASNRTQWAMYRLKLNQLIINRERGIYILTSEGRDIQSVDADHVESKAREYRKQQQLLRQKQKEISSAAHIQRRNPSPGIESPGGENLSTNYPAPEHLQIQADLSITSIDELIDSSTQLREKLPSKTEDSDDTLPLPEEFDEDTKWKDDLYDLLFQMDPSAFERLFQRILRESGFTQVDVTGRSGDGGIDGIGIMRLGGFLSFRVFFQCKRYKGSVSAGTVRDFRGAMIGRTDKGLIVTTGNFTRDAIREATRDGAPEIDLIDGEQLIDKLKELGLGVTTEEVVTEQVTVIPDFFANI